MLYRTIKQLIHSVFEKKNIIDFFNSLGYDNEYLNGTELNTFRLDSIECLDTDDFYFIPIGKQE